MSYRGRELELTISSAKDIKNVNWRLGPNKPYVVVWVDPKNKYSTKVDEHGDTSPTWNERLIIPLAPDSQDDGDKLCIDIVHAGSIEDAKPLIGSASLRLSDVIEEVGFGVPLTKTLTLKRSSGRPHGKIDVIVNLREAIQYSAPRSYHAEPYSSYQEPPQADYGVQHHAPPQPYYGAPPQPYYGAPQPGYGAPYAPPQNQYDGNTGEHQVYDHSGSEQKPEKEKSSKFGGMGMGLAIGATAGVLGGIALSQGYEAMTDDKSDEEEDEEEAEKEEEDEEEEEKEEEEED